LWTSAAFHAIMPFNQGVHIMLRIALTSTLLIAMASACGPRADAPVAESRRSPAPPPAPAAPAADAPPAKAASAGTLRWTALKTGVNADFRGLSVVNGQVVWAGGHGGTIARTTDGGQSWHRINPPPGADAMDFRDVQAFDADSAVVMHAGTPTYLFKTTDGGKSWRMTFDGSTEPYAFLNGVAFWNRDHGVAFGDPVDGRVLILLTDDGGESWRHIATEGNPPVVPGEIGFAASGTSVAVFGDSHAWIGLGGVGARVLRSTDAGRTWRMSATPLASACDFCGVYSLAFRDASHGLAVGGNSQDHASADKNAAVSPDGGRTWTLLTNAPPTGYRSCVAYRPGSNPGEFVAVGVSGSDWSSDDGMSWTSFSDEGYHVVAFSPDGKSAWAAGTGGRIARMELP
jgi:photosystem II stability/assembly factor-like uncharacterized protein